MANVRYAIRDLAVVADEVAREGHKILYLNIGDPCKFDFPTPPHMIEAVHKAMRDGHNSYGESLGIKPAVDAIRHQAEANGFKDIQSIFVGYGSGEVIDSCLTALLNPGDNVLTPSPEYPLYGAVLAKLDAVPNAYDLDESNGWEPDLDDMERKINPRTRAILLINPSNPTGAVMSRQTLEKRAGAGAAAQPAHPRRRDLRQADLRARRRSTSPSRRWRRTCPIITFNGLSKAYLVPGWRIGWAIATGPRESLHHYLEAVHRLLRARLSAPHPFQHAIKPALEGPQDHIPVMLEKLQRRAQITVDWAEAHAARQPGRTQRRVLRVSVARYSRGRSDLRHRLAEAEARAGGAWFGLRPEAGHAPHAHRVPAAGRSAGRGVREDHRLHGRAVQVSQFNRGFSAGFTRIILRVFRRSNS